MGNAFIRKYIMKKASGGDYLHSSGYARAQSGDGVGATSGTTQRRFEAGERQFVKGYDDSAIIGATRSVGPKAKVYTPPPAKPLGGPVARSPLPRPPISRGR